MKEAQSYPRSHKSKKPKVIPGFINQICKTKKCHRVLIEMTKEIDKLLAVTWLKRHIMR